MGVERPSRIEVGWLERLLVLAVVALAVQLFPELLAALDPRNWSRGAWLGLNVVVIVALFGVRFGPELVADWREWGQRLSRKRGARRANSAMGSAAHDADYKARAKRDAEWRERARRRRPWR